MHSSKLLKILRNLTEEEIRRFHKFIRSPYYSYKKHCLPFFEYIRRYYPDFTSSKLSKENAFYHLFPEKAFQSQKMRHVMTDLVNLLEDFLVAEQIRGNDFQKKKLLRDAYGDRDLYEYFEKSTAAITKTLDALPYRNSFYQYESMRNQEVYFFHPSTKKHLVKENYLETINGCLDQYFTLSKLQLATEMKARSSVLSKTYEISYLAEILQRKEVLHSNQIEMSLYKRALHLYQKDTLDEFMKLKEQFLEQLEQLATVDQTFIFYHLLNFTIRKGNAGQQVFLKESFALYQVGLKANIIGSQNKLTDSTFTNMCAIGIKVREFNWVEKFIENYSSYMQVEVRQNAKILCLAYLAYGQKKFKETDELISNFNFTTPFYQLRGKALSLRALLEIFITDDSYFFLLQSNALAFEKFLRRNKTLGLNYKQSYLSFIQIIKQIVNLKTNHRLTFHRKEQLKSKIIKQSTLINREWILNKLKEI